MTTGRIFLLKTYFKYFLHIFLSILILFISISYNVSYSLAGTQSTKQFTLTLLQNREKTYKLSTSETDSYIDVIIQCDKDEYACLTVSMYKSSGVYIKFSSYSYLSKDKKLYIKYNLHNIDTYKITLKNKGKQNISPSLSLKIYTKNTDSTSKVSGKNITKSNTDKNNTKNKSNKNKNKSNSKNKTKSKTKSKSKNDSKSKGKTNSTNESKNKSNINTIIDKYNNSSYINKDNIDNNYTTNKNFSNNNSIKKDSYKKSNILKANNSHKNTASTSKKTDKEKTHLEKKNLEKKNLEVKFKLSFTKIKKGETLYFSKICNNYDSSKYEFYTLSIDIVEFSKDKIKGQKQGITTLIIKDKNQNITDTCTLKVAW